MRSQAHSGGNKPASISNARISMRCALLIFMTAIVARPQGVRPINRGPFHSLDVKWEQRQIVFVQTAILAAPIGAGAHQPADGRLQFG